MYLKVNDKIFTLYDCVSFYKRFKGLMLCKDFNYCLRFSKCNSIHTFFMLKSIDVIMTDINDNILFTYQNLKPWRIILPKKNVYNVYELPAGSIDKKNTISVIKE